MALGAEGGAHGCGALNRSGALPGAAGGIRSGPRGANGGPLLPFGAVGAAFGDTLYPRGPDGAEGGGVCARGPEGAPGMTPASIFGDTNGGRGDTGTCAGDMREARGPVGAPSSANLPGCRGDTGWMRFGSAEVGAGECDGGRNGGAVISAREFAGPVGIVF